MKVIIAGTRSLNDYKLVCRAVELSKFKITEVVSGGANGIDRCGEYYADQHGIKKKIFPAAWDDITQKGAVVKTNKLGQKYNARAGIDRNEEMAKYAHALIAIIQNNSPGTTHMITTAKKAGLKVYVYEV